MNKNKIQLPNIYLKDELKARLLLPTLTTGLLTGILSTLSLISMSTLIFTGNLASYAPVGIALALISGIIARIIVATLSSVPATNASPLVEQMVILIIISRNIQSISTLSNAETTFVSVIAGLALTSVLTGIFLLVLGWLKLGELIRFIPYPVVGGFLAGTGWLLVKASFQVMADTPLNFNNFLLSFQTHLVYQYLSGLCFAIILLIITSRYKHFLVMPIYILVSLVIFYSCLTITHTSIAQASTQGWLFTSVAKIDFLIFLKTFNITQVNWSIVFDQIGYITIVMFITSISLLLSASGLEIIAHQDIDLNKELKVLGIANIAAGLSCGMVSSYVLSDSVLAYQIGAKSRLVGIFGVGVYLIPLLLGFSFLSLLPKIIMGGLVLFIGLSLLKEWIYQSWFKLSKNEYLALIIIVIIIALFGLLEGVYFGLLVAIILFAINYSRVPITKNVLSGKRYKSNVERQIKQQQFLRNKGEQICIIQLQGFIFFGTNFQIFKLVRQRLDKIHFLPLKFIIIDFRLVSGIDSSVIQTFIKIEHLAQKYDFFLVLTNLQPVVLKQIKNSFMNISEGTCNLFYSFPDLEIGLEWCENKLLDEVRSLPEEYDSELFEELSQWSINAELEVNRSGSYLQLLSTLSAQETGIFTQYLRPLIVTVANDFIFREGEIPKGIYFLESGQVSVWIKLENGQNKRLYKFTAGTVIGEMSLYKNAPYSITAITDKPSRLYCLFREDFMELKVKHPLLASKLHEFIVSLLCERINYYQKEFQNLF